jgi:hypothetical protein
LDEEIVEPRASRVFARSPFAYGHDPAVGSGAAITVDGRLSVHAVDVA